ANHTCPHPTLSRTRERGKARRSPLIERPQPKTQLVTARHIVSDLLPFKLAEHVVLALIPALDPEDIVRAKRFGPPRIVAVALDGTESGPVEATEPTRVILALVEETMSEPMPAVIPEQHRFAEI